MATPRKNTRPVVAAKTKRPSRPPAAGSPQRDSPQREKPSKTPGESKPTRSPPKRSSRPISTPKSQTSSQPSSNTLSANALARLNAENEKTAFLQTERVADTRPKDKVVTGRVIKERAKHKRKEGHGVKKRRVVSGALLEEGRGTRGGFLRNSNERRRFGKGCWIFVGLIVLLLIILIPIGVLVVGKKSSSGGDPPSAATTTTPDNSNLSGTSENDIPPAAKGTYLDPFTWYDTEDFNVTYTNDTVGGLPVMGLNSTWDDTKQANGNVPALNQKWQYGTMPIRGVNIGGWLSIEPFITPSLFNSYQPSMNIVDEYTLTQHLGATQAAQTIEKHYSSFVNKQTFVDIQNAGFDHVRIPFSYWAITTYAGDPYVPKISWRYLLRGIEYARECGLRVNLDLHAVPGSQNGWNHSGRQGVIGWLNGTDGALNGQRSLDLHKQISTFFAQPRYKNVIAIYGLVNEPKMISLPVNTVLNWTTNAIDIVRQNGIQQTIAFGDGFLGLPNWHGKLQSIDGLVMDAHQYVIFNTGQIAMNHQNKVSYACSGWQGQMTASTNTATGYVSL